MRLAHHLLRHPSGVWHFRLTVPADLREAFGLRIIKRSLGTRDPVKARAWAYALGARYAQLIAKARTGAGMGSEFEEYLKQLSRFELTQGPDGLSVKTNGTYEDNVAALEAMGYAVGVKGPGFPSGPHLVQLIAEGHAKLAKRPHSNAPTLAEAINTYALVEGKNLRPDTWEQRKRACASFAKRIGGKKRVDEITRPAVTAWANELQVQGLSKRYVANMVSHVSQIFDAQLRAGNIPVGQNPVKGVVVVKKAEKNALRDNGHAWEPLPVEALQRIYDPENLKRTRGIHVRWGALIGLYTGARVSEVAQIFIRDFIELDGVKCVRLTNDSDGQSVKTENSKRLVPLHPDLIKLGLWKRVETLRKQGAERLFPDMRIDSKSGAGNAISKSFSYYLGALGIKPRRAAGIVGFHSLRKSVIQMLQGSTMPAERRRALVGHEPGEDVHQKDYMRAWAAKELATFFPGLPWGKWLDFNGLQKLLQ